MDILNYHLTKQSFIKFKFNFQIQHQTLMRSHQTFKTLQQTALSSHHADVTRHPADRGYFNTTLAGQWQLGANAEVKLRQTRHRRAPNMNGRPRSTVKSTEQICTPLPFLTFYLGLFVKRSLVKVLLFCRCTTTSYHRACLFNGCKVENKFFRKQFCRIHFRLKLELSSLNKALSNYVT